jgi:putative polymerase
MMQSRSIAEFSAVSPVGPRLVLVALLFNMVLCLITTRAGIHMSNAVVIVVELGILSVGLFAIRHRISAQAAQITGVLCVFLTGMKLINPGLDLKIIHDIGIMYIFYELGMMSSVQQANRLVWWAMSIVIAVGLFELLLPNVFASFFDEWTYYVDKGVIAASTVI